ncbi:hypothetical protein RND81_08G145600 [Saponaria officinalis]|uniref:Uncharacterized protein n=1 Tax=Saponaria officinalis TaxID=3572 RepID=A0AAW1J7M6_SAPOF
MQRQSLGSPSRERLVISSNEADDLKRRESSSPPSFTAAVADDDEIKPEKPHRCYSSPEKFIHFIPLLLLFSFFLLYLSSHDPSPQDLAQFRRFNHKLPEEIIEMNEVNENGGIETNKKQLKRSDAFAVRSLRNVQEEIIERDTPKSRFHRKLGDF